MNCVAFIFARGGSKGLPGKNLRPLAGVPLIGWSIRHALAVPRIRRVIVSTDSQEIASAAREFGAEVPFTRPQQLSGDRSPEWAAWRHALEFLRGDEGSLPEAMVSVPTTAPLRLPSDVDRCLDLFGKGQADVVITVSEARANPWFSMVALGPDGNVHLVNRSDHPISGRQQAPAVFDITPIAYVASPEFVLAHEGVFSGRVQAVTVPRERAIDIDTLFDFRMAEWLLEDRPG
jgi:N-acylneuraminate cytidylyltransferase